MKGKGNFGPLCMLIMAIIMIILVFFNWSWGEVIIHFKGRVQIFFCSKGVFLYQDLTKRSKKVKRHRDVFLLVVVIRKRGSVFPRSGHGR